MDDKEFAIYQKGHKVGFKEGQLHQVSSPETKEKYLKKDEFVFHKEDCRKHNINPIMEEVKDIKNEIKCLSKDFVEFKTELKELVAVIPYRIDEKTNNLAREILKETDELYASKNTQTIVYGLVGLILTAVVVALISLVIK